MKDTFNVKIGSIEFVIERQAYNELKAYYADIKSRLYESEWRDIMDDVESRTADIFRETVDFPSQVIDLDMVKKAMDIIGSPHNFGPKIDPAETDKPKAKLYRSRGDRVISGVCGGLADYLNIDSSVVRILMILAFLFFSAGLWVYLIMWIIIPQEPLTSKYFNRKFDRHERR